MNLIVNARDAMPQGGSLIIETKNMELDEEYVRYHTGSKVGEYAMLSITDTGIGMSPAIKAHIFDPFYTTKEEGKGTGLGLATVYGIVKQTEGYIQVYSELEKGTCFRIYFPKSEGLAEKIVHKLEPERMPGGDETILIVEDDNSVRVLAAEVLKHLGYNVIEAKNGIEAMELGQKLSQPIDLLITDLIMPKINGVELSHQLKSLMPSLKVLYISGYSDTAIIHQGFLTPGLPYLQKPFRPTTLAHKVREIIIGK
jgi:CheY-like chemotaxis protein